MLATDSSKPQPGGSKVEPHDVMDGQEEGEAPDDMNEDDAAMMAMMGVAGFGSTKVNVSAASGRSIV